MTKIVLFNGPPGSGKDTAADMMALAYPSTERMQFKDKLFEVTAMLYNVPLRDLTGRMYTREAKEMPHMELNGLSPRRALIFTSECVIKPNFGEDYFGEALGKKVRASDADLILVSDSGFLDEALALLDFVPHEDILVVRIYRDGCDFDNDSRDYLDDDDLFEYSIHCVDLSNNGTMDELFECTKELIDQFIEE